MSEREALEPCPFCGGAPRLIEADDWDEVICNSCEASVDTVEAWNRRAALATDALDQRTLDEWCEKIWPMFGADFIVESEREAMRARLTQAVRALVPTAPADGQAEPVAWLYQNRQIPDYNPHVSTQRVDVSDEDCIVTPLYTRPTPQADKRGAFTNDDFDSVVHHARVIERYLDPLVKPLSEENYRTFVASERTLSELRKKFVSTPAQPAPGAVERFHQFFRDRGEALFEAFGNEAVDLYNDAASALRAKGKV